MHSDRTTQSQQYSHTVSQASAEAALLHRDAVQVLRVERNPKPYRTNGTVISLRMAKTVYKTLLRNLLPYDSTLGLGLHARSACQVAEHI